MDRKAPRKRLDRQRARAKILKALAHPSRLLIIDELAQGERCVCELQAVIGSDMSTVSKHLAQLRECGLVQDDKRGTQVFYSLNAGCLPSFFQCIDNLAKKHAQRQLEWTRS